MGVKKRKISLVDEEIRRGCFLISLPLVIILLSIMVVLIYALFISTISTILMGEFALAILLFASMGVLGSATTILGKATFARWMQSRAKRKKHPGKSDTRIHPGAALHHEILETANNQSMKG